MITTMERFPWVDWVDWEETQWNDKCTAPPKIPIVWIDGKTGCLGLTFRLVAMEMDTTPAKLYFSYPSDILQRIQF